MKILARVGRGLTFANVIATVALFFALAGTSAAAVKYLVATDTIPSTSDLAGSTYGSPIIAAGKVTNTKLAPSARLWAVVSSGGQVLFASKSAVSVDVGNHVSGSGVYQVDFGAGTPDLTGCAVDATPLFDAAFVAAHPTNSSTVLVTTTEPDGLTLQDYGFNLAVDC